MTHVYLPMEIFNREYWGKLALASKLAEMGNQVTIGHNHAVRREALQSLGPSVFYETKGKLPKTMEHLELLRARGVKLVGQDEEAGISFSKYADFRKWRPEVEGVGFFDAFFAWGQEDHQEFLKFGDQTTIFRTGSPRTLFWGEFGRKFFSTEISNMEQRYGSYVLVITNTTSKNSIVTKRQTRGMMREMNYDSSYFKLLRGREIWEEDAYAVTLQTINRILEESDLNVLIRPHPVEDETAWRNIYSGNNRVHVNKAGGGTPMVLGAKGVVHAGSTLGLESIFHGKNTISLCKLIGAAESQMSANEFSTNIENLNQLVPVLLSDKKIHPQQSEMQRLVTTWSNPDVLSLQASIMLQEHKKTTLSQHFSAKESRQNSTLSLILRRLKYGKSPTQSLHANKRPVIHHNTIVRDFHNLQEHLNYVQKTNISQIAESTFRIIPH